ncbi:hypothetical protein JCM8208_007571 [Rhodotorula glutinis]
MFTPLPSFIGGALLSFSTSTLLLTQGRTLGCSGVAHGTVDALVGSLAPTKGESSGGDSKSQKKAATSSSWKVATTVGLVAGGALLRLVRPQLERLVGAAVFDAPLSAAQAGTARVVLAGLLVGGGTKLANGCTSGHMLLGLARLSKRSLAAVVTFFASALITSRLAPFSPSTSSTFFFLQSPSPSLPLSAGSALALLALAPLLSLPPLFTSRSRPESYHARFHAFLLGMTFSIGLALAGMTRPSKVLAFFAVPLPFLPSPPPGAVWDPSLAMVALGGLVPNVAVWQVAKGWKSPLKAERWSVPRGGEVDKRLVLGSAAFGIGWGLLGICPGPLLAVLGGGSGTAMTVFAAAFAASGLAVGRLSA